MPSTPLSKAEPQLPDDVPRRLETVEKDLAALKRLETREKDLAPLDRLVTVEKELAALKATTSIVQTPVYGIALFLAACAFVVLVLNLPFEGNPKVLPRLLIGAACAFSTALVFGAALGFVKFALKALVEVAAALLLLLNATIVALLWLSFPSLTAWLVEIDVSSRDDAAWVAAGMAAVGLFLLDAVALFFLYPMAQSARTSLDPPD
jgi:hypothetical protein